MSLTLPYLDHECVIQREIEGIQRACTTTGGVHSPLLRSLMVWTAEPCLTAAAAAGRSTAKHMQGGRAPADESGSSKQRSVFVTVGTTKFDSLIREVCAAGCQDELLARGYTELLVQKGKGSFSPPQVGTGYLSPQFMRMPDQVSRCQGKKLLLVVLTGA